MKKTLFFFALLFAVPLSFAFAQDRGSATPPSPVTVTILTENYVCAIPHLRAERGFCVLIEKDGKQYLYDTGREDACIDNARTLGKDLKKTQKIFLSHGHVDHTGGLENVLKAIGHPVEIVAHPGVFDKKYGLWGTGAKTYIGIPHKQEHFEHMHGAVFNFHKDFYEVADGVWLTGEVPRMNKEEVIPDESFKEVDGKLQKDMLLDDNALVLDTVKGLVVITGCGHSGIINILTYVRKTLNKDIYAVIGGMHLEGVSKERFRFVESELSRIFKENHTQVFAPDHCTGKRAIRAFKVDFGDMVKDAPCGASFTF